MGHKMETDEKTSYWRLAPPCPLPLPFLVPTKEPRSFLPGKLCLSTNKSLLTPSIGGSDDGETQMIKTNQKNTSGWPLLTEESVR